MYSKIGLIKKTYWSSGCFVMSVIRKSMSFDHFTLFNHMPWMINVVEKDFHWLSSVQDVHHSCNGCAVGI